LKQIPDSRPRRGEPLELGEHANAQRLLIAIKRAWTE
jgi:hypothetical protein